MSPVKEISAPGMAVRTAAILFVFVIVFTALLSGAYQGPSRPLKPGRRRK
jgi:electron transport complex protein RnfG